MQKKQYPLRIDQELWEELNRWAADELRSVNAQIEYLLRGAVQQRRGGRAAEGGRRGPEGGGRASGPGVSPNSRGVKE
jgi:hypothetical protein